MNTKLSWQDYFEIYDHKNFIIDYFKTGKIWESENIKTSLYPERGHQPLKCANPTKARGLKFNNRHVLAASSKCWPTNKVIYFDFRWHFAFDTQIIYLPLFCLCCWDSRPVARSTFVRRPKSYPRPLWVAARNLFSIFWKRSSYKLKADYFTPKVNQFFLSFEQTETENCPLYLSFHHVRGIFEKCLAIKKSVRQKIFYWRFSFFPT